jgi:dihydroorotase
MKIDKDLIFLQNASIYNPYNKDCSLGSILINNGVLKEIGNIRCPENAYIINCNDKIIAPGFIDIHSHFREPGREDKETLETGANSALSGGFTRVCVMPNTNPPLDSPESINFIIEKSKKLPIQILPIGAITIGQKGLELAEFGKMARAGAIALSDDGIPVQNGQVLRNALEYSQKYSLPVINHAEDIFLRNDGVINENSLSTRLGLPGNPDISESVMVHRDLEIAEYTCGRIHIPHVTTKRSVELIRKYKKMGVNVTAEVTPHHISLTEDRLINYDTNLKVAPPLRTEDDRQALIQGLKDGTIDCIATDHAPHTIEEKEKDFIHSPCGMIGLESAFGLSHTVLIKEKIKTEKIIDWFTKAPADVMGIDLAPFKINRKAELVVLDPQIKWTFEAKDIKSKSKNSPMVGMKFVGKVVGAVSKSNLSGNLFDYNLTK